MNIAINFKYISELIVKARKNISYELIKKLLNSISFKVVIHIQ